MVPSWADSALDDLEDAQDSLDEEADTLEESIEQLDRGRTARSARSSPRAACRRSPTSRSTDPELAAALRDSSTCQELREEAS